MTPPALASISMSPGPTPGTEGRCAAGEDPVKRRQILEGAKRIFVSVGFDAASMNDITREAGVSKSTLYVYFRSKEELFSALMEEVRERYFAEIEALLSDPEHPVETLRRFGRRLSTMIMSPEAMQAKRTVIAVASRMPHLGREFYRHGPAKSHRLVCDYLERACEAGTLVIDDIPLAAHQFVEMTTAGILRRRFFDDEAPAVAEAEMERVVDSAVRLFMAGYGAAKA